MDSKIETFPKIRLCWDQSFLPCEIPAYPKDGAHERARLYCKSVKPSKLEKKSGFFQDSFFPTPNGAFLADWQACSLSRTWESTVNYQGNPSEKGGHPCAKIARCRCSAVCFWIWQIVRSMVTSLVLRRPIFRVLKRNSACVSSQHAETPYPRKESRAKGLGSKISTPKKMEN